MDLQAALNSEHNRIAISGRGEVVTAVSADTQFGISVTYDSPMEQIKQQIKQAIRGSLGSVAGTVVGLVEQTATNQVFSKATSTKLWTGTDAPTMSTTLLFIAVNNSDNVLAKANTLAKFVLPTGDNVLDPPNLYRGGSLTGTELGVQGALSVRIGKWFKATNMFLIDGDFSPTISKEVLPSGLPLYVSIELKLTAYRMVTADEWVSFFLGGG
jgi:hypothetical protein